MLCGAECAKICLEKEWRKNIWNFTIPFLFHMTNFKLEARGGAKSGCQVRNLH